MFKIAFILIFLMIAGNLLLLDFFIVSQRESVIDLRSRVAQLASGLKKYSDQSPMASPAASVQVVTTTTNNSCPQTCVNLINGVKALIPLKTTSILSVPKTSTKGEYVITLGTGSVNEVSTWVDAFTAQAIVDSSNFPGVKTYFFEVVMHIPTAQGEVRARLIDDSTPFVYDGQQLKTTSGTGQLVSIQVPLISGKKTYHVQLHTSIAPAVLDSARIRVVTQ